MLRDLSRGKESLLCLTEAVMRGSLTSEEIAYMTALYKAQSAGPTMGPKRPLTASQRRLIKRLQPIRNATEQTYLRETDRILSDFYTGVDTVASAHAAYVRGDIEIDELEQRLERILSKEAQNA